MQLIIAISNAKFYPRHEVFCHVLPGIAQQIFQQNFKQPPIPLNDDAFCNDKIHCSCWIGLPQRSRNLSRYLA